MMIKISLETSCKLKYVYTIRQQQGLQKKKLKGWFQLVAHREREKKKLL